MKILGAMSRKHAVRQLSQAVRALSSSPAAASVPAPSGPKSGLLGSVTGSSVPTLDIPLPGYEEVKPASFSAGLPATSISTLKNGVRIGCQDVAVRCRSDLGVLAARTQLVS